MKIVHRLFKLRNSMFSPYRETLIVQKLSGVLGARVVMSYDLFAFCFSLGYLTGGFLGEPSRAPPWDFALPSLPTSHPLVFHDR